MQTTSAGGTIAGRYRVLGEIARGGMGAVLLAEDTVLNRQVAVKRLHPHMAADSAMNARFKQEALAAASLTHSGIVTVFDAGEDDEGAFLVMELVDGDTLAERMSHGPLEAAEAAAIGADVARALDHAHERGIVHRDVKPGNVMLLSDGRVKIADFGIAKTLEGEVTHTTTGKVMGTAAYMSPEQVAGEPVIPASDQYALGAVLYEAVSGRKPFEGETPIAVALAHTTEHPDPLPANVPRSLGAVIERAMSKQPALRFETAGDLAVALDAVAGGRTPVVAPVPDATGELPLTEAVPLNETMAIGPEVVERSKWPVLALSLGAMALVLVLFMLWLTGRNAAGTDPTDNPTVIRTTSPSPTTVLPGEGGGTIPATTVPPTTVPATTVPPTTTAPPPTTTAPPPTTTAPPPTTTAPPPTTSPTP